MHLTDIDIHGFGVLSGLALRDLSPGLNVIHGANGSGKTTILHFVRGVFCGFSDARRLKLLPPLKGGTPGGSLGVRYRESHYVTIRHVRPNQLDALAINLTRGRTDNVPALRDEFQSLDRELFFALFAVGNYESQAIEPLVRLALRDGIALQGTARSANWLTERIDHARKEREDLFQDSPSRGRIEELERRRAELDTEIKQLSHARQSEQDQWAVAVRKLREQIARLQQEASWLHSELQAAQADLSETHDRLWSHRQEVIREQRFVERVGAARTPAWIEELHEIDGQIAHSQQVLKDLAASRMQVSVQTAGFAGVETPEIETYFERHRAAIGALERQTERLAAMEQTLQAAQPGQQCVCRELSAEVGQSLESIRQQIYFICQELSRQQAVHHQVLLHSQRESIDACEVEVIRQIQRLRIRRDELLNHASRSDAERLQHRARHDAEGCECSRHEHYVSQLPLSLERGAMTQESFVTERMVEHSNARPGDADVAARLTLLRRQLYQQWCVSQLKWCEAQQQLERLLSQPEQFASDTSLQSRRYEYAVVEQQLADSREQWQSLALLQQVLKTTQKKLQVAVDPPVIEEGSRLLSRLTEGRYLRFHFDAVGGQLFVQNDTGDRLPLSALSRGTLDQAAFAFRLALWNEYLQRGLSLPLFLDDVLNDSDEDRLQIAVEVLAEYGRKQQIVFFTCQEHLANMFEAHGVSVRDLPGTTRRPPHHSLQSGTSVRAVSPEALTVVRTLDRLPAVVELDELVGETKLTERNTNYDYLQRAQPDEPYWLQADSSIMNVPSLSAQMARRLGALGVRHVADLIDLDSESADIPLDSLQISATTLRAWQAECRLLCCVPELSGRDAQALVAIGIMSPSELADANGMDLAARIDRLRRNVGEHPALTWLSQAASWPGAETAHRWTHSARQARSFRVAREWADNRRGSHSRRDRREPGANRVSAYRSLRTENDRTRRSWSAENREVQEHSSRQDREPRQERLPEQQRTAFDQSPRMVLVSAAGEFSETSSKAHGYRFFLDLDSPVIDAPSIGPRMAELLEAIGVGLVSDLLNRDAASIAAKLDNRRVTTANVIEWQQQATLMTAIPEMRGHDVQVLVALGLTEPGQLASYSPGALFAMVSPFVASKEGQRLLRSSKVPDLQEVTEWIEYARHARSLKAA